MRPPGPRKTQMPRGQTWQQQDSVNRLREHKEPLCCAGALKRHSLHWRDKTRENISLKFICSFCCTNWNFSRLEYSFSNSSAPLYLKLFFSFVTVADIITEINTENRVYADNLWTSWAESLIFCNHENPYHRSSELLSFAPLFFSFPLLFVPFIPHFFLHCPFLFLPFSFLSSFVLTFTPFFLSFLSLPFSFNILPFAFLSFRSLFSPLSCFFFFFSVLSFSLLSFPLSLSRLSSHSCPPCNPPPPPPPPLSPHPQFLSSHLLLHLLVSILC